MLKIYTHISYFIFIFFFFLLIQDLREFALVGPIDLRFHHSRVETPTQVIPIPVENGLIPSHTPTQSIYSLLSLYPLDSLKGLEISLPNYAQDIQLHGPGPSWLGTNDADFRDV